MKPFLFTLAALIAMISTSFAADAAPFRHVVMFKFKAGTTPEQIKKMEEEFRKLPSKIDAIVDFEWGTSQTVEEGLDQGYTHCFFVTFKDKAGLQTYLPHPDHMAFVEYVKPLLEAVHVFDYTASK